MDDTVLPTVVRNDDAAYRRDAELYAVIAQHDIRPINWMISGVEAAELAWDLTALFGGALAGASTDTRDDARKQSDAALLRAIKKIG